MYVIMGKKGLQIAVAALLLAIAFFAEAVFISKNLPTDMRDSGSRLDFIKQLGLEVDETTFSEETVKIPAEFGDVYENYNSIQRQAGYDLSEYKGKSVTKYTYVVTNYESDAVVNVNLLCYSGKIIGGDICSTALNGFMLPLKQE